MRYLLLSLTSAVLLSTLLTSGCVNELEILTERLPDGLEGVEYRAKIKATKHRGDYEWHLRSPGLPDGLILVGRDDHAIIKGTPTTSGLFHFKVQVSDRSGLSDTRNFALLIEPNSYPTLEVTTTSLPFANNGVPYSASVNATGGSGLDYTWSVVDQSLPPGLGLQTTGTPSTLISGTPFAGGTYEFTLEVRDSVGHRDLQILQIAVDPPLVITTSTLARGMENRVYSQTLTASGGTGLGYTWSVISGSLPPGLTLGTNGTPSTTLGGTPGTAQVYVFTIEVTDSASHTTQADFTLDILDELTITTPSLPDPRVNVAYAQSISATGGSNADYMWALESGSLPPGFTLDPGPGVSTLLSGTATAVGQYSFTMRATDLFGFQAFRTFDVDVVEDLVILTNGNMTMTYGQENSSTIVATGGSFAGYSWSVFTGTLPPGMILAPSGTPSTTLSGIPTQIGVFNFTLVVQDSLGATEQKAFSVVVQGGTTLTITTSSLPAGYTGQAYSTPVSASGGTNGNYTWTVIAGTLHGDFDFPFSASPFTTISGTPAATSSTSTFTLQVQDGLGAMATATFTLNVFDPISITTPTLPAADTAQLYSETISASGGDIFNYAWSVSQGALPSGLSLTPSGAPATLNGTPTEVGTFQFEVRLEDGTGAFDTQDFTLIVLGPGLIETIAGNGTQLFAGDGTDALQTGLPFATGIAFAPNGDIYLCSLDNHSVYRIDGTTNQVYRVAGDGNSGFQGDGLDASLARLDRPHDINVDSAGNVYIADSDNNRIRRIDAGTNIITTFAGGGPAGLGDGQVASLARLDDPFGISWDQNGDMLIADYGHRRIRRIDMASSIITTVAGTGGNWAGDGPVGSTPIGNVAAVAESTNGDIYFTDFSDHAVRRVVASTQMVETIAGTGSVGFTATGGQATAANLGRPWGIVVDANGDVLFAEERNHRILRIDMNTGTLHALAGTGQNAGMIGLYSGDNDPAIAAELNLPAVMRIGPDGHLYFSDRGNSVIRRVRQ